MPAVINIDRFEGMRTLALEAYSKYAAIQTAN